MRYLLLFGDSIAAGFGLRGPSYGKILAADFGLELVDLSATARNVQESITLLSQQLNVPAIAVVAHSAAEGMLRPKPETLRFLPRRYRKLGWLDPAPYFSQSVIRGTLQRIESAMRWRLKAALMRFFGAQPLVSKEIYLQSMNELINGCIQLGALHVVVLGPLKFDERYYPGSSKSTQDYFDTLISGIGDSDKIIFMQLEQQLEFEDSFFADNLHPNELGHSRIAEFLSVGLANLGYTLNH